MAKSSLVNGRLGYFTGIDLESDQMVGGWDTVVPIYDANLKERTSVFWGKEWTIINGSLASDELLLQNHYANKAFVAGIEFAMICNDELSRVETRRDVEINNLGIHQSQDPTAGSLTYWQSKAILTTRDLQAGEELFIGCPIDGQVSHSTSSDRGGRYHHNHHFGFADYIQRQMRKPIKILQDEGICIDTIGVQHSSSREDGVRLGWGAFSTRRVSKNEHITSSPVIAFDRHEMEIVRQFMSDDAKRRHTFTDQVERY